MGALFTGQFTASVFQETDVANGAVSTITPPTAPAGAAGKPRYALIQAQSQAANWRDDGTDPTNSAGGGMLMAAAAEPQGFAGDLSRLRFISTNAGGTKLAISWYW